MRSMNEFANGLSKSYKTAENAQRAVDKALAEFPGIRASGYVIVHRSVDDRFGVIFVNVDYAQVHHIVSTLGFGAWR